LGERKKTYLLYLLHPSLAVARLLFVCINFIIGGASPFVVLFCNFTLCLLFFVGAAQYLHLVFINKAT